MPHHAADGSIRDRRRTLVLVTVAAAVGIGVGALVGGALPVGFDGADPTPGAGATSGSPSRSSSSSPSPSPSPTPEPEPVELTLVAAGDVLPHDPVVRSATADGSTDFSPLLAGLDRWVEGADIALCHLEVPVAPEGTDPSGYPLFGAPRGLVRDLAEQGWDGCSTASNHSVDRGYDGVVATLDALDAAGLGHAGTARSAEEQTEPQVYELRRADRTIRIAHLSATYGLNGLPMPEDAPWAVDLIDGSEIVKRAREARDAGADLVVVSLHAGVEYTETLTEQQEDAARWLARSRAVDLVIGHHAHVPQRIERVGRGPDGDGMWVAFGLGNMLSNQSDDCCDARTSNGILLSATIAQPTPDDPVRVTDVRWTATTVDIPAGHRVRALPDAVEDPRAGTLSADQLRAREELVRSAAGTVAGERREPTEATGEPPTVVPRTGG